MRPTPDLRPLVSLLLSFLLVALLASCAATREQPLPASKIFETADLADVSASAQRWADEYGKDAVLVVFDIDNTLLAMEQDLGSDQWYDWQKELQGQALCHPGQVADLLKTQGALYFASAMRLTQPDAPALIQALQDERFDVIALTSRGPDFQLQTFRELRRNGISFYPRMIGPVRGYPDPFLPEGGKRPALYQDGVFLTAGQDKGVMLQALLDKTGTPAPKVVLMADDKESNLQAVLDAFAGTGTSVQAFRYNREDATVNRFDADEANRQWRAVAPALRQLQLEFGADHYALPASSEPPCAEPDTIN